MLKLFILLAVFAIGSVPSGAQAPQLENHNSEAARRELEMAGEAIATPRGALILVGRLGRGEKSSRLTWTRLKSARWYLLAHFGPGQLDSSRIILATGEPTSGRGVIEIFVNGEPFRTIVFPKNRNIEWGRI